MSRFVSVSCTQLSVLLHTPFVTALRRTETTDTVVVRVTDDDGITGWGEAPQAWQVTGESLMGATACVERMLGPLVVGRDTDDWEEVAASLQAAVARNFGAKAAVDVALRDLSARRAGVTLAELLGVRPGRRPNSEPGSEPNRAHNSEPRPSEVRTDVTLSAGSAPELAASAAARVADGFRTLKMKVGTDARTDVERVLRVRDAVGPHVTIRLDANQGWTVDEAVEVIRALEAADLGVELVEQPVAGEDVEGLAQVRQRVGLPIMADESLYSRYDLERILRLEAADLVNVKLAKCGSLAIAAQLLDRAAQNGLGTMVGSMMETPIGLGAMGSLVAAQPTSLVNDLDAAWWAASSPVVGGPTYHGDRLVLSDQPGLGVSALTETLV